MHELYEHPEVYDFIFSYRNYSKEADFLEDVFRRFSKFTIGTVLDIACGPAPHMGELIERGYDVTGMDISQKMIDYARKKTKGGSFIQGDMKRFRTEKKFDAGICMGSSLCTLKDNAEYYSHLESVSLALKKDGIYIIDLDNPARFFRKRKNCDLLAEWECNEGDRHAKVKILEFPVDYRTGMYPSKFVVEFAGKDSKIYETFASEHSDRLLTPQEIRALVFAEGSFNLASFFGNYCINKGMDFKEGSWRMIPVLMNRRRQ